MRGEKRTWINFEPGNVWPTKGMVILIACIEESDCYCYATMCVLRYVRYHPITSNVLSKRDDPEHQQQSVGWVLAGTHSVGAAVSGIFVTLGADAAEVEWP